MKQAIALFLVFVMMFSLCSCGEKDGETADGSKEDEKGSVTNPYSLGESFEITAYDVVPYSAYTPEGRQVEKPIAFGISNVQVLNRQTYSRRENGKEVNYDNFYLISFELEVLESSVSDSIYLNFDYLKILNLNTKGKQGNSIVSGSHAEIPDGYTLFNHQSVMPLKGLKWDMACVLETEDEQDLAYIIFHYCGEDGEFHNIYVQVDELEY